ncbi:MAG: MG2 domain-containing protein, partial [Desulfatitalea sp.]
MKLFNNYGLSVILVVLLVLLDLTGQNSAASLFQASFDCAKASAPIETLICSDETLATLDRELGLLFTNARNAIEGETDRLAHLKEQREWLKSRLTTCQIPRSGKLLGDVPAMRECLIKEMRKRNEILTESLKKAAPEIQAEAAPFDSVVAAKTEELKITRIIPKGDDVDKREQIVFQFNRPVVPIGKMDRNASDVPIEITPQTKCQWRWLNRSTLACNLDKEDYLFLATHYKVNVKPGIMDEKGTTISAPVQHEFITARPRVLSSQPYTPPYYNRARDGVPDWEGPGIPVIDVRFNQQVTSSSVAQSLYIEAKGERYALKVTPSASSYQEKVVSVSLDKRNFWINTSHIRNDEPVQYGDHTEPAHLNWIVRPQKALPEDTEYFLKVEPGLVSAFGPLRGIENRIVATGSTLPAFSFLGFQCTKNDDKSVFIAVGDTKEKCSVFKNVQLVFSAPVDGKQFTTTDFLSPPMKYLKNGLDPREELENSGYYYGRINHEKGKHYGVSLPKVLKNSTPYTVTLHGTSQSVHEAKECIKDVFDRCLSKDVSASFSMDRYRPTLSWSGESSVLEKDMPSDVSLYSANIDQATIQGEIFTAQGGVSPMSQEIPLLATLDHFERSSFGVRNLLQNGSGIVSGEIKLLPETATLEGRKDFFAQVTPFHVHVKVGEDSGLVWVTDLATGKPVESAEITVFEGSLFGQDEKTKKIDLAAGRTNSKGLASIPGYNALIKNSTSPRKNPAVLIRKGEDIAYLSLEAYGDYFGYRRTSSGMLDNIVTSAWGMTAEGVYRPGKVVDYKVFVRDMHSEGARLPELRKYQLEIHDPKGAIVEKKDITLSEFGTYADTYATGKNGVSGKFQIYLRSEKPSLFLHVMDFLVTDYVPASFKVETTLNQQVYKYQETVAVDTVATLHSGGPFTDATNRYSATLYGKPFRSTYPATEEFWFGSPWCEPFGDCGKVFFLDKEDRLDQEGKAGTSFVVNGERIGYGTLQVESAVEDDRGKKIANMAKAEYFGIDRFVGLKTENFVFAAGKPVKFRFVVTDGKGVPIGGVPVSISSSGQRYMAYVAKGAGNSYVTRPHTEQNVTDNNQQLLSGKTAGDFEMVFNSVGEHSLTASIEDSKGRYHETEIKMWVTGPDAISWGQNKDDALDFVTKKTSYTVGETATILVKNPYPKAKALITVERMGIVKSWVESLDSSLAPISFTVTEDMAPNFALSVVVFSPRVDTKQVDDSFDLGKPEWRMGYVQMEVKGKKHKFDFKIDTDMDTYRPGQEVHAKVQVTPRDKSGGGRKELAIAVLDEAVFDLIKDGMTYFDPQKGFYGTLIDSVQNYNILRKLVTHAPATPTMKGDDPGGDGAMADRMRSDLKSLAYWKPTIITDDTGKAEFTFKAPDNLTGWRILVLATDQNDHLDVGYKNIKVNRLTEIQPAMPNQVIEGDSFVAAFSVMNRTPDKRKIKVNISAQGTLTDSVVKTVEKVEVGPFERKVAKIKLTAGKIPMDRNIESGQITLSVQAGDALDKDALTHQLVVNKKKNLDVGANYGTTSEAQIEEPLLFPEQIRSDMGDVTVTLSPTLIGDLEGAFRFMKSYPYTCWEQKLSRAVMAANYQALKKYLSPDLTWDGSNGTIAEAIDSAKDFQAPNG